MASKVEASYQAKILKNKSRIFKSVSCLMLAALCFSFFAESLGPILITTFTDHSHEASVSHQDGKTRLILVHDHDRTAFSDGSSETEHPDHEHRFMEQDIPFLLAAKSGVFSFPPAIPTRSSLSCLFLSSATKPFFPSYDPGPQPLLIRVRSVVILV